MHVCGKDETNKINTSTHWSIFLFFFYCGQKWQKWTRFSLKPSSVTPVIVSIGYWGHTSFIWRGYIGVVLSQMDPIIWLCILVADWLLNLTCLSIYIYIVISFVFLRWWWLQAETRLFLLFLSTIRPDQTSWSADMKVYDSLIEELKASVWYVNRRIHLLWN